MNASELAVRQILLSNRPDPTRPYPVNDPKILIKIEIEICLTSSVSTASPGSSATCSLSRSNHAFLWEKYAPSAFSDSVPSSGSFFNHNSIINLFVYLPPSLLTKTYPKNNDKIIKLTEETLELLHPLLLRLQQSSLLLLRGDSDGVRG